MSSKRHECAVHTTGKSRVHEKSKKLFASAVRFYLTELLPRSRSVTAVDVHLISVDDPRLTVSDGWCCPKETLSREHFEISMARRRRLNLHLGILAHECVHVVQFACGQLAQAVDEDGDACLQWLGRCYPPMLHLHAAGEYVNTPWEIEAYARTDDLANRFMDAAILQGLLTEET